MVAKSDYNTTWKSAFPSSSNLKMAQLYQKCKVWRKNGCSPYVMVQSIRMHWNIVGTLLIGVSDDNINECKI
jgi:hypothetical protein